MLPVSQTVAVFCGQAEAGRHPQFVPVRQYEDPNLKQCGIDRSSLSSDSLYRLSWRTESLCQEAVAKFMETHVEALEYKTDAASSGSSPPISSLSGHATAAPTSAVPQLGLVSIKDTSMTIYT